MDVVRNGGMERGRHEVRDRCSVLYLKRFLLRYIRCSSGLCLIDVFCLCIEENQYTTGQAAVVKE